MHRVMLATCGSEFPSLDRDRLDRFDGLVQALVIIRSEKCIAAHFAIVI